MTVAELKKLEVTLWRTADTLRANTDLKASQYAKATEFYFGQIARLQERFPNAVYKDVTGLCKLASPDEVKEQEYSLNPGRYMGVVIEEDGKTEARDLEAVISKNIRLIAREK